MNLDNINVPAAEKRRSTRYRVVAKESLVQTHSLPLAENKLRCVSGVKPVGVVFLAILLLLIFFSKTIYSYNLPKVTAIKPENGRLSKLEMSVGVAGWSEVENLYSAVGGKVEETLVKEGDTVAQGQELYRLSFDRDEADRRLREIQNNRSRLETDIQSINLKLNKTNRYMTDLENETYEPDEPDKEDDASSYELDLLSIDIRTAKAELTDTRERYNDGDATELDVERARSKLQGLYIKYDELEEKIAKQKEKAEETFREQEEKAMEAVEEQEKNRKSKLQDYESDIAALKLELQQKNIELNGLAIQEEPYKKALGDFESHAVIAAPTSGTVVFLGAVKGETIKAEQLIASIGANGAFEVECSISLDNNFVIPGDVAELSNATHVMEAKVKKITPTAQNKTVTIELSSDKVTAGETFEITFKKDSDTTYILVPNGALNQDNDGYFLNQIKRRDGILGKEYYLERLNVYIGDSDSKHTAIVQGITFFEPIAQVSDKPVTAGDVISLSNAGDFFEQ